MFFVYFNVGDYKKPPHPKGQRKINYIYPTIDEAENESNVDRSVLWDDDSVYQVSFGGRGYGQSNDKPRPVMADNYISHTWLVTQYFKVDVKKSCYNETFAVIND